MLNSDIAKFLAKVVGIYVIWYLVYELWLLPEGSLDQWLSLNIVGVSAGILDALSYDVQTAGRLIWIGESPGINLVDGCNGIAAIGLFIGFVVAFPGDTRKKWAFIITGIGIIYLVNVARIVVLTVTQIYWPAFFDITHDYSTTAIFYMVIFALWVVWANYGASNNNTERQPAKAVAG